jgi:hypothetical protein
MPVYTRTELLPRKWAGHRAAFLFHYLKRLERIAEMKFLAVDGLLGLAISAVIVVAFIIISQRRHDRK